MYDCLVRSYDLETLEGLGSRELLSLVSEGLGLGLEAEPIEMPLGSR